MTWHGIGCRQCSSRPGLSAVIGENALTINAKKDNKLPTLPSKVGQDKTVTKGSFLKLKSHHNAVNGTKRAVQLTIRHNCTLTGLHNFFYKPTL
jgi:hypothetical protein